LNPKRPILYYYFESWEEEVLTFHPDYLIAAPDSVDNQFKYHQKPVAKEIKPSEFNSLEKLF